MAWSQPHPACEKSRRSYICWSLALLPDCACSAISFAVPIFSLHFGLAPLSLHLFRFTSNFFFLPLLALFLSLSLFWLVLASNKIKTIARYEVDDDCAHAIRWRQRRRRQQTINLYNRAHSHSTAEAAFRPPQRVADSAAIVVFPFFFFAFFLPFCLFPPRFQMKCILCI